eukprot:7557875-Ditylum_brightwellii.AAC.1
MAYDGLHGDLDAEKVHKRLLSLDDWTSTYFTYAKVFLQVCLVKHNMNDNKQYVNQSEFTAIVPQEAKMWARQQFAAMYKTTAPAPAPIITTTQPSTTQTNLQAQLYQQPLCQLEQQNAEQPKIQQVDTMEKQEDILGMSKLEIKKVLKMFCLTNAEEDQLLDWICLCNEKGQLVEMRDCIITKILQDNKVYYNMNMTITRPLLK